MDGWMLPNGHISHAMSEERDCVEKETPTDLKKVKIKGFKRAVAEGKEL